GDGSEWSVQPEWEAGKGMVDDVFEMKEDKELSVLRDRFKEDPWFLEVINYLGGKTRSLTVRERRWLHHKAAGFWIEDGKLWKASTKAVDRAARTECIPCSEGLQRAHTTHKANGHFAWEHTHLHLQDHYFWPTL
ncbi:hypothetical protein M422DRAFT_83228, partial [Sphaerobolus stellatus SS14]